MIALAGAAAAAPPEPSVAISGSCTTKNLGGTPPKYNHVLSYSLDVSYKGKWVAFTVDAIIVGEAKSSTGESRWDSNDPWPNTQQTLNSEAATGDATLWVQVTDRKDGAVGNPTLEDLPLPVASDLSPSHQTPGGLHARWGSCRLLTAAIPP